ncbi:MAG: methyl-accepting chemotaxis protein [Deltaproteobacteria bacterium]|nr:methyl-accepting chemotaxis protein [Deltaproteobacteria bacterium]MBN2672724.1 methyl-accepting chemotaxis protein [Deltaproteobacteria bacterium]
MKRRLTLAQKLTLYIAAAVFAQIFLIDVAFIRYFGPRLEKSIYDVVERAALSNALMYAARWNFDAMVASNVTEEGKRATELEEKMQKTLKASPEVSGFAIYRVNEDALKSGKSISLKKQVQLLASANREKLQFDVVLKQLKSFRKDSTMVVDDNVFAGTPIIVEDELVAYLVHVESIRAFHSDLSVFKWGIMSAVAVFVLLQLISIFWIGYHAGRPLTKLAQTATKIAAGDLTQKVDSTHATVAETESLSKAIRDMSHAINEQVSLIKSLTLQASGASRDVAKAMSHLASSAAEQAAAVSQTATTVEEMEKSGKSVAEAVKRIVDAAIRSAEASTRGRQAVDMASGIIVKIKEDSANISMHSRTLLSNVEEVGNIINSVNAIAEQSKILAVNASIEAAKAGEYGSGFAVVAQEVKSLAGQSKEATEQITRTLTSIRQSVEGMVRLARDGEERTAHGVSSIANTGAIVNDLSDAIQEASEVANEIDSAVGQQSMGLSQIASAMDEINISASENQQISKEMEKNTMGMTASLEELSVLVDIWTTADLVDSSDE